MQPEDVMAQFKKGTTENGLDVYSLYRPVPWIACEFIVHAGSVHDPVTLPGLAHLSEHLSRSQFAADVLAIGDWFKRQGGSFGAGTTGPHYTDYSFSLPIEELTLTTALGIFDEMLFENADEAHFNMERSRVIQEIKMKTRTPHEVEYENEFRTRVTIGANHRVMDFAGTVDVITKATANDVRAFRTQHYRTNNISIACVGGLKLETIIDQLNKKQFGRAGEGGERVPPYEPVNTLGAPADNFREWDWKTFGRQKTESGMYRHGTSCHKSLSYAVPSAAIKLLRGKLFRELSVKRGWIYDINTGRTNLPALDVCDLSFKYPWEHATEIRDVVLSCINQTAEDNAGIEVQLAIIEKSRRTNDPRLRDYLGNAESDVARLHRIRPEKEIWSEASKVTVEDVRQMILRFLPPHSFAQQIVDK